MTYLKSLKVHLPNDISGVIENYAIDQFADPLKNGDFTNMASLHSWYKHLSLNNPTFFTFICAQNIQPSGYSSTSAIDGKLHWYFFRDDRYIKDFKDPRVVEIVKRHAVRMNPFIYHELNDRDIHYIILLHAKDVLREWLNLHQYVNAAAALEKVEANTEFKDSWPYSVSSYQPPTNTDLANLSKEINLVWKAEIARQGKEMSAACRHVYDDLLKLGYTLDQLNQPFNCLLKNDEKKS